MEKVNYYVDQVDRELKKVPYFELIDEKTKIPKLKTYIAIGFAVIISIFIFFNIFGDLLSTLIAFIYPAYASFKAIESTDKSDDTQWLTYWTVFGFLHLIECFSDQILGWISFYYFLKSIFTLWLSLPQFRGAEILYEKFVRVYLLRNQSTIDGHLNKAAKNAESILTGKTE
ncbi:receptor accessory protein 5 [Neocallimastix lanati (nom. inval.)]|jgi:receptor expression-enhancing protein 5/6|uniref:Protein YOP1 n=1 Tax=Neocallimastix californiae TaxID=1754190 RepID=A0A1Y2EZT7_9FUNG|nr:receptor accessory protein 5 [Neocallimastix sp. JGI-2020a]ORY77128.1 receptor accessory protein 5 [Neocallimastix californiae]|eukprot:ORY77128.1 receptor accessory protein 5 [Neocallimastix californiae]